MTSGGGKSTAKQYSTVGGGVDFSQETSGSVSPSFVPSRWNEPADDQQTMSATGGFDTIEDKPTDKALPYEAHYDATRSTEGDQLLSSPNNASGTRRTGSKGRGTPRLLGKISELFSQKEGKGEIHLTTRPMEILTSTEAKKEGSDKLSGLLDEWKKIMRGGDEATPPDSTPSASGLRAQVGLSLAVVCALLLWILLWLMTLTPSPPPHPTEASRPPPSLLRTKVATREGPQVVFLPRFDDLVSVPQFDSSSQALMSKENRAENPRRLAEGESPCSSEACLSISTMLNHLIVDENKEIDSSGCRDPYSHFCQRWEAEVTLPSWQRFVFSRNQSLAEDRSFEIISRLILADSCEGAVETMVATNQGGDQAQGLTLQKLTAFHPVLSCLYELCADTDLMDNNLDLPLQEILVELFGVTRQPLPLEMPSDTKLAKVILSEVLGRMIAFGFPTLINFDAIPDTMTGNRSPSILMFDPLSESVVGSNRKSAFVKTSKTNMKVSLDINKEAYSVLLSHYLELFLDIPMSNALARASKVVRFETSLKAFRVEMYSLDNGDDPLTVHDETRKTFVRQANLWVAYFRESRANTYFSWEHLSRGFLEAILSEKHFSSWVGAQEDMENLFSTVDHIILHKIIPAQSAAQSAHGHDITGVPPLAYVFSQRGEKSYIQNLPNFIDKFISVGDARANWQTINDYLLTRIFIEFRHSSSRLWREFSNAFDEAIFRDDGAKYERPKEAQCVDTVIEAVPWVVSKAYIDETQTQYHQSVADDGYRAVSMRIMSSIDRSFMELTSRANWIDSKSDASERTTAKLVALHKGLGHPDWLHASEAHLLAHFTYLYGDPITWLVRVSDVLARRIPSTTPHTSLSALLHQMRVHSIKRRFQNVGRENNALEPTWQIYPFEAETEYRPEFNMMTVPDSMLQPPFLVRGSGHIHKDRSDEIAMKSQAEVKDQFIEYLAIAAANYGSLGTRIASTMVRCLDTESIDFNEVTRNEPFNASPQSGNYKPWIDPTSRSLYLKNTDCLTVREPNACLFDHPSESDWTHGRGGWRNHDLCGAGNREF
eukprot:GHVH01007752.1.p1 GENE.GHVH01007752.1~~GHVH01007752.1.p1  ORF type:complete len:1056 (+),score=157.53 GHVH01007752.1:100-3267(+)